MKHGFGLHFVAEFFIFLVSKLQLGNASVWRSSGFATHASDSATPAKHSFKDNSVPKLELGNEGNEGSQSGIGPFACIRVIRG